MGWNKLRFIFAPLLLLFFMVVRVESAASWSDLIDEGNRFEILRDFKEAKKYYLQAFELAQKEGKETPRTAESQARLAAVCVPLREIKAAEKYAQAALTTALAEKRSGHLNEEVAVCMEDLAGAYVDEAPAADAEYCYKKAIDIREKLFGPEHPNLARSYGALAVLYMDQNRFKEAAPFVTKYMSITSRSIGSGNYSLPKTILSHAITRYQHADRSGAEKMIAACADLEARIKSDRYRSTRQQILAVICADRGDLSQAESLFKQAIRKDEVSHPNGGRLANSYAQLARFYCQQKRHADAQKYFERARNTAINGRTRNLGDIVSDQKRCLNHQAVKPILNLRLDH